MVTIRALRITLRPHVFSCIFSGNSVLALGPHVILIYYSHNILELFMVFAGHWSLYEVGILYVLFGAMIKEALHFCGLIF
jgi:hypothetical protein